jgi:GNAT superfamily N-acetyltransferase
MSPGITTTAFTLDPKALPASSGKGRLTVIVTFMEMTAPPAAPPPPKPPGDVLLMRAGNPTVAFYRFLYNTVGEPWLWNERRRMTDADLHAAVADPSVDIQVLYVDGTPAGYIEIDRRECKGGGGVKTADIGYFGLMPEYLGRGLGPWLLRTGVDMAWQGGTAKLTVNTCSFDHPSALGLYMSMGFKPVRHVSHDIPDPRVHGWLPHDAAPHIPING